MNKGNQAFDYLMHETENYTLFDTHEHLPYREEIREKDTDILCEYLIHYQGNDLVSSGMSSEQLAFVKDHTKPLMERWKVAEPFWENCRYTGYSRALDLSVQGLYQLKGVYGDCLEELNERFLKTLAPGHYEKVLKEKSKIKLAVLDANLDCDKRYFRSVIRLDRFICPMNCRDIRTVSEELHMPISSLDDWIDACEKTLDNALNKGAVAIKMALAYVRSLHFEQWTKAEAEKEFFHLYDTLHHPAWENAPALPGKAFQDYMMHQVLHMAARRSLIIQIHTGYQSGNGNYIQNTDPVLLNNLFLQYPTVKFDIFHMGYPYQHVLPALAKTFPNVYLNLCWAHILSPTATVAALSEWIDMVPANKIFAFGGDYKIIDAVYGCQLMAREHVCRALAKKIDDHIMTADQALKLASKLFCENAEALYLL